MQSSRIICNILVLKIESIIDRIIDMNHLNNLQQLIEEKISPFGSLEVYFTMTNVILTICKYQNSYWDCNTLFTTEAYNFMDQ